jgi:hypothetical protein
VMFTRFMDEPSCGRDWLQSAMTRAEDRHVLGGLPQRLRGPVRAWAGVMRGQCVLRHRR